MTEVKKLEKLINSAVEKKLITLVDAKFLQLTRIRVALSLKNVSHEFKILLLKELGYDSDGEFVLDSNGDIVLDRYLEIPVKIESMLIFSGNGIILDDNELSISKYLEEFGDVL